MGKLPSLLDTPEATQGKNLLIECFNKNLYRTPEMMAAFASVIGEIDPKLTVTRLQAQRTFFVGRDPEQAFKDPAVQETIAKQAEILGRVAVAIQQSGLYDMEACSQAMLVSLPPTHVKAIQKAQSDRLPGTPFHIGEAKARSFKGEQGPGDLPTPCMNLLVAEMCGL